MHEIMQRLFTQRIFGDQKELERCALFFGHDYGWKNYLWASQHLMIQLSGNDDSSSADGQDDLKELKNRVDTRYQELMEKR